MTQEQVKEEKKKGIFSKLKEASEDKEEQLAILSTFVQSLIHISEPTRRS